MRPESSGRTPRRRGKPERPESCESGIATTQQIRGSTIQACPCSARIYACERATELHDDGFVHPDFYMIAACTSQEIEHDVTVTATLPSGTKIRFTLAPAVATGSDISSCGDTLRKTEFEAVVP